jgi:hypothetical protein
MSNLFTTPFISLYTEGGTGTPYLRYRARVKKLDQGYFNSLIERIADLNKDETLHFLIDECNANRIKFASSTEYHKPLGKHDK